MKKILLFVLLLTGVASGERFFDTTNTWYTPIPASPTVTTGSSDIVTSLKNNSTGRLIRNYNDWSVPIWRATAGTTNKTVTKYSSQFGSPGVTYQVPIPDGAKAAGNDKYCTALKAGVPFSGVADGHMLVISADGNTAWDFYHACYCDDITPGVYRWRAQSVSERDLTGTGVYWNVTPQPSFQRLAGVPLAHGIITYDEVQAGTIDHAILFIGWASRLKAYRPDGLCNGVYPSKKCNSGLCTAAAPIYCVNETTAPIEGMRFQLVPSFDCNAITNSIEKIVCVALQTYGAIYVDDSERNGGISVIFEDREWTTPKWTSFSLDNIPFNTTNFRVVEPIYPGADPCLNDTTPPTTPTNLAASSGGMDTCNISWTASTDLCSVVLYTISRCTGVSCTTMAPIVSSISSTSIVDSGLAPSTTYRYKVQAFDAINNASTFSSIASCTTDDAPTASTRHIHVPTGDLDLTADNCTDFTTAGADVNTISLSAGGGAPAAPVALMYLLADDIDLFYCVYIPDSDIQTAGTSDTDTLALHDSFILALDDDGSGTSPDWKFVFSANGYYADYVGGVLASDVGAIHNVVTLTGTLNDHEADTSWRIKGSISWSALGISKPLTTSTWKMDAALVRKVADVSPATNVYLCNSDGGSFENVSGMCSISFDNVKDGVTLGNDATAAVGADDGATLK